MAVNAKLILINSADAAVLAAYPEPVPGLPVGNLQLQEPSFVMRSTSAADQAILGNLPSARAVAGDGLALFGEFSADASLRVRLFSGLNSTGTVRFDSTWNAAPRGKKLFGSFAGAGNYQSFTLNFSDVGAPLGWHELGRLFIGRMFSPEINLSSSYGYAIEDTTDQERDAAGGIHSLPGAVSQSFEFRFEHLTEAERSELHDALLWVGKTRDVFCALRPGHEKAFDFAGLCKFTKLPKISNPYPGHYSAPFELSESSGGYAGTSPSVPPSSTGAGIGALNSEWRLALDGRASLTTPQAVASNGAGLVLVAYQGRTLMRSADHGLTWLPVVLTACPSLLVDVRWSGNYFLAVGDSGDIYSSLDGLTWETEASLSTPGALRFDCCSPWDDGFYLAAGDTIYIGHRDTGFGYNAVADVVATGLYLDPIAFADAGRSGPYSCRVFPAYNGSIVLQFDTELGWAWGYASGVSGNWLRAFTGYGDGLVLAATTSNRVYRSTDGGVSFATVYTPPANYLFHDFIIIPGPYLVISLAGPGGQRLLAISNTGEAGSFTDYAISAPVRSAQFSRLAWTGKRAVITDAGAVRVSGVV